MDLGLKDKIALITGGSRGIGRAIALALANEGCKVAICARDQEPLERALQQVRATGAEAIAEVADVRSRPEVEAVVERCAAEWGGVDILVNNVGGAAGEQSLLETEDEDWVETFDLNVFHAVRTTRAALPYMRQRGGGAVVIVSSISGWKPGPKSQYGSAKAAEIFLAGALALELAECGVRVNTVAPGSIFFLAVGGRVFRKSSPSTLPSLWNGSFPLGAWGRQKRWRMWWRFWCPSARIGSMGR